ncbi:MAG: ATP-dependent DNA helicase RecQ, partial [Verrucomicrobiales bacterium]
QREVIEILLSGGSALAVFPTGSGKSLCYQLPALEIEGLTLVISPLIALMVDQVTALRERGIAAARLDSTLESAEVLAIYKAMEACELKLLYVAPERLANAGFLERLRCTRLGLIAIDEAHCISEWGHNFRPDYLKLGKLCRELGVPRVLGLTATATARVAQDICRHFEIPRQHHIQTGFHRPNLDLHVTPCAGGDRDDVLASRLVAHPGEAAIVYVTLQQTAERVAAHLSRAGISARPYHAGLADDFRSEVQADFMGGKTDVIVATIAFGMGIDKADIRAVYHYNLPKSLENYVQETGRAGRDGAPAHCEVLACADDRVILENFVYGDTPSQQAMRSLSEHLLLRGEEFDVSHYDLSVSNDIRRLVIATAITYLELEGVLSATGPFYAQYRFKLLTDLPRLLAGHDSERTRLLEGILEHAKKGRLWYQLELAAAAEGLVTTAPRLRAALTELETHGDIVLQPRGLRHGYRRHPEHPAGVGEIADLLGELFANREAGEIARLDRIQRFCEERSCLTR